MIALVDPSLTQVQHWSNSYGSYPHPATAVFWSHSVCLIVLAKPFRAILLATSSAGCSKEWGGYSHHLTQNGEDIFRSKGEVSQITVQQRREKLTHDLGVLLRLQASVGLKSLGRRRGGIETLTGGGAMAERTAVVEKDEHIRGGVVGDRAYLFAEGKRGRGAMVVEERKK
ncbi:hypothetical protein FA13DRAFT_1716571 [Coprinellus micaceus]|uniref:Uncharacterized protein n=1 Tax=Coprinellus micaceus TaxID=71717 RepID=A0A4Y7SJ93_COPMI|nr:hypothetical protein FA13DRAFT_1716571 [Coprinellus micaceus]